MRYLVCKRCQAHYPVLPSGSPVLLRDPDWKSERSEAGEARYIAQFVYGQFPEKAPSPRLAQRLEGNRRIAEWFDSTLEQHSAGLEDGRAVELGCGPGGYGTVWPRYFRETILCDIRSGFVEHAAMSVAQRPGIFTLVCDAQDPPFRAGSMAMVAAVNLLDIVPEPLVLLRQMDMLLQPGGLLVLALPYVGNFQGPDGLLDALRAYRVLASEDWVPWIVPVNERLVYEYQTHLLVARKDRRSV